MIFFKRGGKEEGVISEHETSLLPQTPCSIAPDCTFSDMQEINSFFPCKGFMKNRSIIVVRFISNEMH